MIMTIIPLAMKEKAEEDRPRQTREIENSELATPIEK